MKGWNEANMAGKETITKELLEACEVALGRIEIFEGRQGDTYKQIAAAIAKAEGGE